MAATIRGRGPITKGSIVEQITGNAVTPFVAQRVTLRYRDEPLPAPAEWPADLWDDLQAGRISYRRAVAVRAERVAAR
ncbi:hypothetical protein MN032_11055 [Agromyces atrinae]|uniref:hypothetical protein n=1 Tax=Agromyces atrinae TaxID=592376 RepID=UPI001F579294|nr:hypothetical protein [Agromyces atrinae]MCI2958236.1 hypothetical protein [Agromyces atrinae]